MVYYTGDIHGDKRKIEWLCEQVQIVTSEDLRRGCSKCCKT